MGQRVLWTFRRDPPVESDSELTDRAREGDRAAFGELYRRHRKAAHATAWCLLRSRSEADDVVSDAFAGVLSAIRNGSGPRDNFRTYLLACVRNGCRVRRPPVVPIHDDDAMEEELGSAMFEDPERYVEANTVARAFASLAPRWQHTLWLSEVEQRPAHEISEHFKLSPNATAALTHRARQAFATAYLAEHVSSAPNDACVEYAARLAAYVRNQLTEAQHLDLERHLIACAYCAQAVDELRGVNTSLRSLVPAAGVLAAGGLGAQLTVVGSSLGGASAGLLGGGFLLKGVAALLVVAPVLVADTALNHRDAESEDAAVHVALAADAAGASESRTARPSPAAATVGSAMGVALIETSTTTAVEAEIQASGHIGPADVGGTRGRGVANVGVAPVSPVEDGQPSTLPLPSMPVPGVVAPVSGVIDDALADVVAPIVDDVLGRTVVLLDEVLASAGLPQTDDVVALIYAVVPSLGSGVLTSVLDSVLEVTPLDPDASDEATISELLDSVEPLLADQLLTVDDVVEDLVDAVSAPVATAASTAATTAVLPTSAPGTSTSATTATTSAPASTAGPGIPLPGGTAPAPAIALPIISVPPVEVPILNLAPVTLPIISVPPITLPNLAAS